jgi:hypothetical protein
MASKKSATWNAAATGCSYYLTLPIGVLLIFTALFAMGSLITGLILLIQQWAVGWATPVSALITVGIFLALFALMLPAIAPILRLTDTLQTRYRKARERLHYIHDEQARIARLIEQSSIDSQHNLDHEVASQHFSKLGTSD